MTLLVTLGVVLALDQASKAVVRSSMRPTQSIPILEDLFYLTYVRNTGAAFGLMPGQQNLFIVTSVLVLFGIALYWWRARPASLLLCLSLGCIAGGAIGNLIDRTVFGRVTDFLDFQVFPVFNIADIGIVSGAAGLFIWAIFAPLDELAVDDERHGSVSDDRDPASSAETEG